MADVMVTVTGMPAMEGLAMRSAGAPEKFRRIPVADYRDKMQAGWIGQIADVCWGASAEFKFKDQIIPDDKFPGWKPEMINNAFSRDDLYVEMTFCARSNNTTPMSPSVKPVLTLQTAVATFGARTRRPGTVSAPVSRRLIRPTRCSTNVRTILTIKPLIRDSRLKNT